MSKRVSPCGVNVNRGVTSDSLYVVFRTLRAVQSANTVIRVMSMRSTSLWSLWRRQDSARSRPLLPQAPCASSPGTNRGRHTPTLPVKVLQASAWTCPRRTSIAASGPPAWCPGRPRGARFGTTQPPCRAAAWAAQGEQASGGRACAGGACSERRAVVGLPAWDAGPHQPVLACRAAIRALFPAAGLMPPSRRAS